MIIFVRILIAVYILAINVYSFMLVYNQKKQSEEKGEIKIKDGKLYISAILGGGAGIYLALFILQYRTHSLFLMISIPLIIAFNVFIFITIFSTTFTYIDNYNIEPYNYQLKNIIF